MLEFEHILFLLLGVRSGDDDVHGGGVTLLARGVDSRPENIVGRPEESNKARGSIVTEMCGRVSSSFTAVTPIGHGAEDIQIWSRRRMKCPCWLLRQ
jgi:hypothetical protein